MAKAGGQPKRSKSRTTAQFIEPMECLPVNTVPEDGQWTYELKLDGYRLEAVKRDGKVTIYSRRGNVLNQRFPYIAAALSGMPDESVIDGEVVAVDDEGRSDFNLLQNFRSAADKIHYYVFDVLLHEGTSLLNTPLSARRKLLHKIVPINDRISLSAVNPGSLESMLSFVRENGLEGVIGKRADSFYEPGKRTGSWVKHRINLGQEFVVGGYTKGTLGFDALIVGFYRDGRLIYSARVRAGFIPASRREVFDRIKGLKTAKCPFANLPEKAAGRWGQGLTAEKMKDCVWLKPETVVRIDFLEWTDVEHLRHTKFAGLRDDKDPRKVVRET